ncbi:MAG: diguanylate cyclase [Thiobacillus sp.]|nr:diguanylate cyclase [Thiobacillus sp.]
MAEKSRTEIVAEQLAQLREDYRARLPTELAALSELAETLNQGEQARGRLEDLHNRLHKLAGSGGAFGFTVLGTLARTLEHQTQHLLTAPLDTVDALTWQNLVTSVAQLGETLSCPTPTASIVATQVRPAPSAPGKTVAIWLVEDDLDLAGQLARQLESFNYAVRHFLSIHEAETAAQTQHPDLLIMDIMFPQQDENATEVLALRPTLRAMNCPLLFVTANDDFASRVRASRLGAAAYFLKPVDIPKLVNRLAQVLDKRNAPPRRVLIVDDDRALATHYHLTLRAAGIESAVLDAPDNIIEFVSSFHPELILLDLHMPDFSGPELAGVIRQYDRWSTLPIVYLSAETDLDQQIDALGRGADDFLTKPIAEAQLVAAVRSRVDRARELDAQISRDSLTGLLKHASIKEALEIAVARAFRLHKPMTVAMLDIDHFKAVNDNYGHAVGDVVISSIAMLLRQRLRQTDVIGRYGGEEFVAILPECDSQDAFLLLEDIRQRFASIGFSHDGKPFFVTLSAGLASSTAFPGTTGAELLIAADQALYGAKREGRNQIMIAG